MEMELDLQYQIDVVLKHWKAVLVVFLAATIVAAAVSFMQDPTYQATTTLVEHSYEYLDVPRLISMDRTVAKLYPSLVRTETVENKVIAALGSSLSPQEKAPGALKRTVTLREDKDNPSVFRLQVQANDPSKATLIANTWAEQYVETVGILDPGWSTQLETVQQDLESTEEQLTAFRQETGLGLVEYPTDDLVLSLFGARVLELENKSGQLAVHRQASDNLLLLIEKAQLAADTGGGVEDLPLQLLNTPPIVDRGQLSVELLKEQEDLHTVVGLLDTEEQIISDVVDDLSLGVEQLQEELGQDQLELERLVRARDLAEGAYTALTNKVRESQLFRTRTEILSPATKATLVGPDSKLNVIVGAALGLAGGVLAAFALEYFEQTRKRA